jgi:hypothetical protein
MAPLHKAKEVFGDAAQKIGSLYLRYSRRRARGQVQRLRGELKGRDDAAEASPNPDEAAKASPNP